MKKLFVLFLLLLGGCSLQQKLQMGNADLSLLNAKFNQATEIKSKYKLENNVLIRESKADPKDRIIVKIGEEQLGAIKADFEPSLTISRWDEVSFKIKPDLSVIPSKDKNLSFDKDKTILSTPKVNYILYELPKSKDLAEGGFEYEIVLKEKPANNVISLNVETQGLDFFYQSELTQKEIDEGAVRPENVIGSYAVYASEQKINWVGKKEYKAGKVGHIYRPKIIDSAGNWIWGKLNIDKQKEILSVEIPQEFLDTAVYPVIIDPTFGYETLGSSYTAICLLTTGSIARRRGSPYSPASNGTTQSVSFWATSNDNTGSQDLSVFINQEDSEGSGSHGEIASGEVLDINYYQSTSTVKTVNVSSGSIVSGTNYIISASCDGAFSSTHRMWVFYDASANFYYENFGIGGYANSKENPWTIALTGSTDKYSMYATFAAAGITSCTCPTSGDWNVDCAENCLINSSCWVDGTINLYGAGSFNVLDGAIVSAEKMVISREGCKPMVKGSSQIIIRNLP